MASVTFSTGAGGDGSTVTDDSNASTGLANGGHRTRFVPALTQVVNVAQRAVDKAAEATTKAAEALASASSAANAPGTNATSPTSFAINTGQKNYFYLAQAGKLFSVGQQVLLASAANPLNWMSGTITLFVSGTGQMGVNVTHTSGSGTYSDWVVSLSGAPAAVVTVVNELKGSDIASATTVNLDTATGNLVHITGTTTITGFTLTAGRERTVVFDGVLTLTNSGTLVLPGGINIVTSAGDTALVRGDTGAVRVVSYLSATRQTTAQVRVDRSSNTILGQADCGKFVNITSGTFTQTFSAASALGNGWWCDIRNAGTGDITVSSGDSIDGLGSYVMYPGEIRRFTCNGSTLTTIVLHPFYKVFTATGTFVKPPGYNAFGGLMWNGGSSGGKSSGGQGALGGGGGGCFPFTLPASSLGSSETLTVGGGGAAVTAASTAGNLGGASAISSWFSMAAPGSSNAGSGVTAQLPSQAHSVGFEGGAIASGGSGNMNAIYGGGSTDATSASGSSLYGGGGGGSLDSAGNLRAAGTSKAGGNGGASSLASSGTNGAVPGGGGGATQTGAQSGAGARGEIRIWGM